MIFTVDMVPPGPIIGAPVRCNPTQGTADVKEWIANRLRPLRVYVATHRYLVARLQQERDRREKAEDKARTYRGMWLDASDECYRLSVERCTRRGER